MVQSLPSDWFVLFEKEDQQNEIVQQIGWCDHNIFDKLSINSLEAHIILKPLIVLGLGALRWYTHVTVEYQNRNDYVMGVAGVQLAKNQAVIWFHL